MKIGDAMRLTYQEAVEHANRVAEPADREYKSLQVELVFERRSRFLLGFTREALDLLLNMSILDDRQFMALYQHSKDDILDHVRALQNAEINRDFVERNRLIDFFQDVLSA